jgi:hypothetical protein
MIKTKQAHQVAIGDRLLIGVRGRGVAATVSRIELVPFEYIRFYFSDAPRGVASSTWGKDWEVKVEE